VKWFFDWDCFLLLADPFVSSQRRFWSVEKVERRLLANHRPNVDASLLSVRTPVPVSDWDNSKRGSTNVLSSIVSDQYHIVAGLSF